MLALLTPISWRYEVSSLGNIKDLGLTWLKEEFVGSSVAGSSLSISSVVVPLVSQMLWKFSQTYLKLICCQQTLKMTDVLLWKHVFEDPKQLIVLSIQATAYAVFPVTSSLQINVNSCFNSSALLMWNCSCRECSVSISSNLTLGATDKVSSCRKLLY